MSINQGGVSLQRPFRPGDSFDLEIPGIKYYPDHPLMKDLTEACTNSELDRVKRLVMEWQSMAEPSLPPGPSYYPVGTIEPVLYHAIRENQADIVAYLLDKGVKMSPLAIMEAVSYECSTSVFQVFLDRGLDVNTPKDSVDLTHLGSLVEWFLSHGADPNAESRYGFTPFLRAVQEAPLETVQLLHAAGGSPALAVPFVCSPFKPGGSYVEGRLGVLRFVLDAGADLDVKQWVHNRYGYASSFDWGSGLNIALINHADDLVEELLRRGARTDVPSFNIASKGETALELARKHSPHLVPMVEEYRRRESPAQ
ncbi:hypothetical protein AAE478_008983 [Parahypoxylon ruwenzoriense]